MGFTVKLDSAGRIMIPALLRKRLDLWEGSTLTVEERDGSLILISRQQALKNAQQLFRSKAPERILSEELIRERTAEAKRQNAGRR